MSCGSLDDATMRHVEEYTTAPTSRARAIRRLQAEGIETFGMFCPILPGYQGLATMRALYEAFDVSRLDEVWCEPYNDRRNWQLVCAGLPTQTLKAELTRVMTDKRAWARYALDLAQNHAELLTALGSLAKSTFLLYESRMTPAEIAEASAITGMSFQSKPDLGARSLEVFIPANSA